MKAGFECDLKLQDIKNKFFKENSLSKRKNTCLCLIEVIYLES